MCLGDEELRKKCFCIRQPSEIRRTSPLSVFQACCFLLLFLPLLWSPWCPAMTWLCLIAPRSSECLSLILPTLCPTSLHNYPPPNFPYRSHWLSFVCVWKASCRLLARGCRQRTERIAAASPHHSWCQWWFIIPGLGFVCLQLLFNFRGSAVLTLWTGTLMLLSARLRSI